jgi:hypothetical protein
MARSDDRVAVQEREVILRHCKSRALLAGIEMTPEEQVLEEYLRYFLPTLKQLMPTLDQLKHDTKTEIAGLIAARPRARGGRRNRTPAGGYLSRVSPGRVARALSTVLWLGSTRAYNSDVEPK